MSGNTAGLTTALVIPVGPYPDLLADCLAAVRRVDVPFTQIIVVDDSADSSLPLIPGVHVVRSHGVGPYQARNIGWAEATADVIFFCDVRCRPRTNWTSEMLSALGEEGVVLAGSDVWTLEGRSVAAKAAAMAQPFLLSRNVEADVRSYFPNCNMAVYREALELAGGFPHVRSGGDAFLCWAVLDATDGKLGPIRKVLMDWVPRDNVKDLLEQFYRYGKGSHALAVAGTAMEIQPRVPLSRRRMARRSLGLVARGVAALTPLGNLASVVLGSAGLAFEIGYAREHRAARRPSTQAVFA